MTNKILLTLAILAAVFLFGCSGTSRSDSSEQNKDKRSDKKESGKKDKDKGRDDDEDDDQDGDSAKDKKKDKGDDGKDDNGSATAAAPAATGQCNKDLWQKVYNAERLTVKADCTTVTGTIAERNADEDGDEHMLLKLDAGQEGLLTDKNKKKKDGNLVIEAVCVNPTSLSKVGSTCRGYTNSVNLPQVGDHVSVTGSYVVDSHNGWTEIHPITSIEKN